MSLDLPASCLPVRAAKRGEVFGEERPPLTYSIQLQTRYGPFLMNRHDRHQPLAILQTGAPHIDAEIQSLLALSDLLPDGAQVVDAGANIGLISVPLAQRLAPRGGTVMAFEPQRLIYYMLAGNTVLAGLDNLVCLQLALGDAEGEVVVPRLDPHQPQDFGMVSLAGEGGSGDRVRLITIDSLDLPRLDLLKIDVEQLEIRVLNGASQTIARCRPLIWIEVWPAMHAEVHAWMEAHDYDMGIADELNFCAVPRERRAGLPITMTLFDGTAHPFWDGQRGAGTGTVAGAGTAEGAAA